MSVDGHRGANLVLDAGEQPPLPGRGVRAQQYEAIPVLIVSTLAVTGCFMAWKMFGLIGIPIDKALNLPATELGILTASPVLAGRLVSVLLGMWTDNSADGSALFVLTLVCVVACATEFRHCLVPGMLDGLAGGSFSAGGPFVARCFDRKKQGFAPALMADRACRSLPTHRQGRSECGVHGLATAVSGALAAALRLLRGGAMPHRRPGTAITTIA